MTGPRSLADLRQLARLRLRQQRLTGPPAASLNELVGSLGAVQAQEYAISKWGLGQRLAGATDSALDAAFDAGEILRTHALRPTWHFVLPADIAWIQALTGPRVQRASASIHRRLGLDERARGRASEVIVRQLEGGKHLTRRELAVGLADAGLEATGLALAYHVMSAELDGLICSGPRSGRQHTYALVSERAPTAVTLAREEAVVELVRRYFSSHGPATLRDFGWWSGLTQKDARAGLAALGSAVENFEIDGLSYHVVEARWPAGAELARPSAPLMHLLPIYDEHLIAYRDRVAAVDERLGRTLPFDTEPLVANWLVSDGRLVGGWRRVATGDRVDVKLAPLFELRAEETAAAAQAAERLARFLGLAWPSLG